MRLALDKKHQRNHHYDTARLATEGEWTADVADKWLVAGGGKTAHAITDINQVPQPEEIERISEMMAKGRAMGAQALSTGDGYE